MINLFSTLRYQNYATARYLAFTCGSFQRMSHYLLGMTLELSYKQIFAILKSKNIDFSNNENKLIERSHNLIELHNLCLKKNVLTNINDYETFLEYADIMYKTRYPSHLKDSQKLLSETFTQGMSFSIYNIYPFDDLIYQIDNEIFEMTNNEFYSLQFLAIDHINTQFSNSIFHCNGIFFESIDNFIPYLNPNKPQNYDSLVFLEENRISLLKSNDVYLSGKIKYKKDNPLKEFKNKYSG